VKNRAEKVNKFSLRLQIKISKKQYGKLSVKLVALLPQLAVRAGSMPTEIKSKKMLGYDIDLVTRDDATASVSGTRYAIRHQVTNYSTWLVANNAKPKHDAMSLSKIKSNIAVRNVPMPATAAPLAPFSL
jgi:hypothetical protein